MIRSKISTAGLCIEIVHHFVFNDWLAPYACDAEPDFVVSPTMEEIAAERAISLRPPNHSEFSCAYRSIAERLPDYDAFVMHGAVVCRGEDAFVITAPSGTGKSTHAALWLQCFPDAWILNGDKPIIRKLDGRFYACGTPWRGKEGFGVPGMAPVRAIALLRRGEINEIQPASGKEMISFLMKQVYLPKDAGRRLRQIELMDAFLRSVPSFTLRCNMDPSAAQLSWETMSSAAGKAEIGEPSIEP